jgi:hypothetical protein
MQNTLYQRLNTHFKSINIASGKTFKKVLLVVETAILIRYYYQTASSRALYEYFDEPTGQPADNPHNEDGLGVDQ